MTAADERLVRAASALLQIATRKQTDRDYIAAVAAEVRVLARLLAERAGPEESA